MRRLLAALRSPPNVMTGARGERTVEASANPAVDSAGELDERPAGCGWFDSSHALQHGLHVTEHASADAVAAELPLADWLHLHLCGWSAGSMPTPLVQMPSPH
jgi:hypothetical protein